MSLSDLSQTGRDLISKDSIDKIFEYLRLGEAAKLPAVHGSMGVSGWAQIPQINGAVLIIQWGSLAPL
ncbi:hypothetical protein NGK36_23045, partial [Hafnia alvei]|nr:hypothetical protein [Hafnia alvei]